MNTFPILKKGDTVEIIAPASRCSDKQLSDLQQLLTSWHLNCIVSKEIFGNDLLCAHTDEMRFQLLKNALYHPTSKAIICARGGYGSMRLIPNLMELTPHHSCKLFLGMSDITALHIYFQQHWQWPVLHGSLNQEKFTPESILAFKPVLFGEVDHMQFKGIPLNTAAKQNHLIQSTVTGGNLCLIQASIGTPWQLDTANRILFLEEIGERGFRIDRMLEHLTQAGLLKKATAIVFGDVIKGEEPDGVSLVDDVLQRFADQCPLPVIKIKGIGHSPTNFPLPLGTKSHLQLGEETSLTIFTYPL